MKERLKAWNEDRKRRAAMKVFMTLFADEKSTMRGIVQEAAYKMSREMFMQMLDNEGFQHCHFCPIRAPLRKVANAMLCELHHKKVMEDHDKLTSTQKKETPPNGTERVVLAEAR